MLESQERILDAAAELLEQAGYPAVTIDRVAERAACAKGLVHYHFGTKSSLLAQAVRRMGTGRDRLWQDALDGPIPERAVTDTWDLLRSDGVTAALVAAHSWAAASPEFGDAVRSTTSRFARTLSSGLASMFESAGLEPTVPPEQLGWLLVSVVHGMAAHLAARTAPEHLEEAYAAAWVGIISLTRST